MFLRGDVVELRQAKTGLKQVETGEREESPGGGNGVSDRKVEMLTTPPTCCHLPALSELGRAPPAMSKWEESQHLPSPA